MQRKTINNEGELRKYQEVCFSAGYHWNSGSTDVWRHEGRYPIRIITRPETMTMTWTTVLQPRADIAESLGNEAVYLEALKKVWAVICETAGEVNVEPSDLRKQLIYNSGYRQIRSIVNAAIYTSGTSTGEVDMTQEHAEREMSIQPIGITPLD